MNLNPLAVAGVSPVTKKEREPGRSKVVDRKVQDLVSLKVNLPRVKEGSLLATGVDPTRKMIPGKESKHQVAWEGRKKKKDRHFPRGAAFFPIGLKRCDSYPWINALMQFLLFVPSCREILSYIPKSLQGIREFSDRVISDAEAKKSISLADGALAAGSLLNKFPNLFRGEDRIVNLDEALQVLWQSASLLPVRPNWHILWDADLEFEPFFVETLEWLIGLKQLYEKDFKNFHGNCLERHYLLEQSGTYMEMDAFIEARLEEGQKVAYFVYLKVGGTWVQCADEEIIRLKSSKSLEMPLRRGILFHFKKVPMR